eukprot:m.61466 g.61466  ORF g.61466 m.61466 type:complete len:64 (-) comp11867_c0_seq1:170-361(-)
MHHLLRITHCILRKEIVTTSLPLMLRSEVVMKVQPQTVILDAMREHTKLNLYDNDSIVDDKGQ